MVDDGHVHRRHTGEQGRFLLDDVLEDGFEFEPWMHDDRATHGQCQPHHHRHGEHMEEREHAHHALLAPLNLLVPEQGLLDVGVDVRVRQHGAFRDAGGAAGVLEDGDVLLGLDVDGRARSPRRDQFAEGDMRVVIGDVGDLGAFEQGEQEILREGQDILQVPDDELPDAALLHRRRHLRVQGLEAQRHHDGGAGVLDLPNQVLLGIQGAVVHDGPARAQDAEIGDDELWAVRQEQADLHALLHAQ